MRGRSPGGTVVSLEYLGVCGKIRRSPPMKFRIVAPALAVALLAMISSSAQAGLFSHHSYSGCGCEPACGAPAVTCCDTGPSCCDSGCGYGHRGLFSCFKFRKPNLFGCHSGCGCAAEPACGCEASCEPACGCASACEPACGCEASCEPACGCASACDPCARRHCGGLLARLFAHKHRCHSACGCAAEPACGCAVEASCGCEPACGCN